jgi:hypothetical protein
MKNAMANLSQTNYLSHLKGPNAKVEYLQEAQRQQLLLRCLWRAEDAHTLLPHLRHPTGAARGLAVYQANAGAAAESALAAAYPVVQALISASPFANLARALWQAQPPTQGDRAQWGEALAAFVERSADLASEPYLADVARLEWAVHRAHAAADPPALRASPLPGISRLASEDLSTLGVQASAGTALVSSPHPIVSIWSAHQSTHQSADDSTKRFAAVRAAFTAGQGEHALVYRQGFGVQVVAVSADHAAFTAAVLQGQPFGQALQQADDGFVFEPWLRWALQQHWLQAVV